MINWPQTRPELAVTFSLLASHMHVEAVNHVGK